MTSIRRPNNTRFLSKKSIIVAICCLYAVVLFSNSGKEKKNSSLRASVVDDPQVSKRVDVDQPQTAQQESLNGIKKPVDEQKVQQEFKTVLSDIEDAEESESKLTMGWLHDKVLEANKYIHGAIDSMIHESSNDNDISVEDFDEEISMEVEEELQSDLKALVDEAMDNLHEELLLVQEKEIGDKNKSEEDIELDVESIRTFYIDKIKDEIDELEGKLESKIHAVTTKVEKDLLAEDLGFETTEEELEMEEVNSVIIEAEDEVLEAANDEIEAAEDEVEGVEEILQEEIKKSLDGFLIGDKKMSSSKANEVEETILNELSDEMTSLFTKEEGKIEDIANDKLDQLDESTAEDAHVVSQAAELGMKSSNNDDTNVAEVIEPRLDNLKEDLEEYLQQAIVESKNRLIDSLSKVTEDVEIKVFKEEGIDISEEELAALVEKETQNVSKVEPAE